MGKLFMRRDTAWLWYIIVKGVGRFDASWPGLITRKGAMTQCLPPRRGK